MRNTRLLLTLMAGAALGLSSAAQAYEAAVFARASAGVAILGAPGSTEDLPADRSASTTGTGLLSLGNTAYALTTNAAYTASASGHAYASVSPGMISLLAAGHGSGTASPPTYYQSDSTGYGYASGSFRDGVTLDIVGVASGTLVWVDFSVRFDGVSDVTRTGVAGGWGKGGGDYHWGLQITSAGWGAGMTYDSGTRTYQLDEYGNVPFNSLDFGTKSFGAWLMTGTPLGLNAWAWVQAFGRGGFSFCPGGCTDQMAGVGSSLMDASHTWAWNGVQAVSLADGTVIDLANVSLRSDTGLDLMQAVTSVPEPGAMAMVLAGLLVVGWRARRSSPQIRGD